MKTSEQINELAGAMAEAQGKLKPAAKDAVNPAYRSHYATLASVWDSWVAVGPACGLTVWQDVQTDEHGVAVITRLVHKSGQWAEFGPFTVPVTKHDAHGVGSAASYSKRYALTAALGIVTDDDDDGNAAVAAPREEPRVQATGPTRIKSVTHKEGKAKTGKAWQRWDVEFEDGRKASTFRQDVAGLAQRIEAAGLLVTPAIESPDGRNQNLMGLETDGEIPAGDGEPQFDYEGPKPAAGPGESDRAPLMKRVKALEIERHLTPDEKKELGRTIIGAGFSLATAPIPNLVSFVEFLEQAEAVAAWRFAQAKGAA